MSFELSLGVKKLCLASKRTLSKRILNHLRETSIKALPRHQSTIGTSKLVI